MANQSMTILQLIWNFSSLPQILKSTPKVLWSPFFLGLNHESFCATYSNTPYMILFRMSIVFSAYVSSIYSGGIFYVDIFPRELWRQFCWSVPIYPKPAHWVIQISPYLVCTQNVQVHTILRVRQSWKTSNDVALCSGARAPWLGSLYPLSGNR